MKIFKTLLITWSLAIQAGLPPTTLNGVTTFNFISDELLKNPDLEVASLTGSWTCSAGTASSTNTAGEVGKGVRALKMTSGAGTAIRCYQTVTTLTGAPVQHYVRGFYKFLLADLPDFQICSLINGNLLANEQTCIPTANLISDNTYRPFEIPITVAPGQSVGVVFKTTATSTAKSAFVDTMSLRQGLGLQNLQLDTVYSAQVSIAGVVSAENTDWIQGNCSGSAPYSCTFKTGIFTVAPNCTAKHTGNTFTGDMYQVISTATAITSIDFATYSGAARQNAPFNIICQKSGNDYLAASSSVYASQNANYSRRPYTPTFTGFGTVSGVECFESRDAEYSEIDCRFTTGTTTSTEARVSLPSSLTTSTATTSIANFGSAAISLTGGNTYTVLSNGGLSYVTFGLQNSGSGNGLSGVLGTVIGNTITVSFKARVPISGWSNSNVIVGSFDGIEKCKDNGECDDTFSAKIVTGTGVVSGENKEWITSCTAANPSVCTISGFTVAPNCTHGYAARLNGRSVDISSVTSTGFTVTTTDFTGALEVGTVFVSCQKTGVDYKPKTAKIASSIGVATVPGITTPVHYSAYIDGSGVISNKKGDLSTSCTWGGLSGGVLTCALTTTHASRLNCTCNISDSVASTAVFWCMPLANGTASSQSFVAYANAIGPRAITVMCDGEL